MLTQRSHFLLVLAVGLGGGVLVHTGTASGITCFSDWVRQPGDGDTNVPTNTRLWAYGRYGGRAAIRLVGPEGEVPVVESFFPVVVGSGVIRNFPLATPASELEPNTRYFVETDYAEVAPGVGGTQNTVSFTTGDGPVLKPPALPRVVAREQYAQGSLAWSFVEFNRGVELGLAFQGLLVADNFVDLEADLTRVDLATAGTLGRVTGADDLLLEDNAEFDGFAAEATSPVVRFMTDSSQLDARRGDCGNWPETELDRVPVRLGAFDLAGNFSGWTAEVLEIPSLEEAQRTVEEVDAEREGLEAQQPAASVEQIPVRGAQRGDQGTGACSTAAPGASKGGAALWLWAIAAGLAFRVGCAARRKA